MAFPSTVFASEDTSSTEIQYHHILDSEGLLSQEDSQKLEEAAESVYDENGVELFAYVTGKKISKPDELGESVYNSSARTKAAVVMMIDSKSSYIKAYGRAESIFTSAELKKIRTDSGKKENRTEKILSFIDLTGKALTKKGVLPIPEGRLRPRLVDDGDLLSRNEEYNLVKKLDDISEKRQIDVVIVTNNSLEGKTVEAYADDFFDYNGYGFGEEADGILLLVSMDTREWAISTCGKAINIFTDSTQDNISDNFVSYLSDGDYYGGFVCFANLCDSAIEDYQNGGSQYSVPERSPFGLFTALFWSSAAGMLVGLIVALSLRSQLTSVQPQAMATAYSKPGSLKLTEKNDMFLYHNITRVRIPRDSGSSSSGSSHRSGGHSRTHTSSSGRSHGGSHGHF